MAGGDASVMECAAGEDVDRAGSTEEGVVHEERLHVLEGNIEPIGCLTVMAAGGDVSKRSRTRRCRPLCGLPRREGQKSRRGLHAK